MDMNAQNWPGAIAMIVASLSGVFTLWLNLQNVTLKRRVSILETEHRECREHLTTEWPSETEEFLSRVMQVRATMKLEGQVCTLREVAMVLRRMQREKKPA